MKKLGQDHIFDDLAFIMERAGVKRETLVAAAEVDNVTLPEQMLYRSLSRRKRELGERGALMINLLTAISGRRLSDSCPLNKKHTEPEIAMLLMGTLLGSPNELVYIVSLDENKKLIGVDFVGEGTVNTYCMTPRRIVELALDRGAKYAYLAHNHPFATAEASANDLGATRTIGAFLNAAGVRMLGHYVISMLDASLIEEDPVSGDFIVREFAASRLD